MRMILLLVLAAAAALAQGTVGMDGPLLVRPGRTVDFLVTLTVTEQPPPAGVQWKLTVPLGLGTLGAAAVGQAADAAAKEIHCSDDRISCLVVGMNPHTIAAGQLARYTLHVHPNAPAGLHRVQIAELIGATAAATPYDLTAGTPLDVRVLHKADLDGDGQITREDLLLMLEQALGKVACTDDLNGDGRCDLLDAMVIINAALEPQPNGD